MFPTGRTFGSLCPVRFDEMTNQDRQCGMIRTDGIDEGSIRSPVDVYSWSRRETWVEWGLLVDKRQPIAASIEGNFARCPGAIRRMYQRILPKMILPMSGES
jgi:hypothetical protein